MNTEPMVTDVVSQIGNSSPNNMNLTSDNYANMDHDALMEQLKLLMEQNRNQQAVIQSLRQRSRSMQQELDRKDKEIRKLNDTVTDKTAQLNMNSSNSSIPPSKCHFRRSAKRKDISSDVMEKTDAMSGTSIDIIGEISEDIIYDDDGNVIEGEAPLLIMQLLSEEDNTVSDTQKNQFDTKYKHLESNLDEKQDKKEENNKKNRKRRKNIICDEEITEKSKTHRKKSKDGTKGSGQKQPGKEACDESVKKTCIEKNSFFKRYRPFQHGEPGNVSGENARASRVYGYLEFPSIPDESVFCIPEECKTCKQWGECEHLAAPVNKSLVKDVIIQTKCTSYYSWRIRCPHDGKLLEGSKPSFISGTRQYGLNVYAIAVLEYAEGIISYDRVSEIMKDIYKISIAPSTVHSIITRFSEKLKPHIDYIKKQIPNFKVNHFDETGVIYVPNDRSILENGEKSLLGWLHCIVNDMFTLLTFSSSRGYEGIEKSGVIKTLQNIGVHDCWGPYFKYDNILHQLCCAHLLRELIYILQNDTSQYCASAIGSLLYMMYDEKLAVSMFWKLAPEERKDEHGKWKRLPGEVYTTPIIDEDAYHAMPLNARLTMLKKVLLDRKVARETDPCAGTEPETSKASQEMYSKAYDTIMRRWFKGNPEFYRPDYEKKYRKRKILAKDLPKFKAKMRALMNRLILRKDMYLLFFMNFIVPFTNNLAEISFRIFSVREAVSKCFRTEEGVNDFAACISFIDTCKKHGINVFDAIIAVLSDCTPEEIFEKMPRVEKE